jgi:hypothetical protein
MDGKKSDHRQFIFSGKDVTMKIGMRKPSIKKSLKARTTGKLKRSIKRAIIPGYGKKGMGWIRNPKRALYNKIYRRTSFSVGDLFKRKKD